MKRLLLLLTVGILSLPISAQSEFPELSINETFVSSHLHFLSADELRGRRTGEIGNEIAARYIAEELRSYGISPVSGQTDYLQPVPLQSVQPTSTGSLIGKKQQFTQGDNLMLMAGPARTLTAEAIFAGHGWVDEEKGRDDYAGKEVRGKIVVVHSGKPGSQSPIEMFQAMAIKRKWAAEKGAVGLIEVYGLKAFPWKFFVNYFQRERIEIRKEDTPTGGENLNYGFLLEGESELVSTLQGKKKIKLTLQSGPSMNRAFLSHNVIGVIEGSDPQLKEEYLLLTAHFDHVGTGKNGGGQFSAEDSIFNGARDNACGTTALLTAANALAQKPPQRSVIVLAVTGEEVGLLGSQYYAENPMIPLKQTIFNLNTDGGGYNNTENVAVIGFNRVGAAQEMRAGAKAVGLGVIIDPAPEAGLFDRSDNVSFAAKGVPAPTFSTGMTGFDAEINKYYHQVADEVESLDMGYIHKYCQAYAHAARLIANKSQRPMWVPGDKYEPAGKALYGNIPAPSPTSRSLDKTIDVGAQPIEGAEMFFDGSREMLDAKWTYWQGPRLAAELPIKWKMVPDPTGTGMAMDSNDPASKGGKYGAADIVTKQKFRDFRLHVEFLIADPKGNSGVYLQNRYEIQILDGDSTKHGLGAIINETPSPYNAYRGVGKWNAYDVVFRAARFENGKRTEKAMATVYFNGKKVHINQPINQVWGGPNSGIDGGNDKGKGITDTPGGLKLQAEGHHVLYRNIWIKDLNLTEANTDF